MTEALHAELDARFVLMPMPPELVKGIAHPVVTYAVVKARWPPLHRLRRQ